MSRITFSRRHGGFTVSMNGLLSGMILSPETDIENRYRYWRFISQWGDLTSHESLLDAKEHATRTVLYDEPELFYAV